MAPPINATISDVLRRDIAAALAVFDAAFNGNVGLLRGNLTTLVTLIKAQGELTMFHPERGTSLLYLAARGGHMDCVTALVSEFSYAVNATNSNADGSTALHGACYGGHEAVVRFLESDECVTRGAMMTARSASPTVADSCDMMQSSRGASALTTVQLSRSDSVAPAARAVKHATSAADERRSCQTAVLSCCSADAGRQQRTVNTSSAAVFRAMTPHTRKVQKPR